MLDVVLTAGLVKFAHWSVMRTVNVSAWVNFFIFVPLFMLAAYQDQKDCEISGWLCTLIAALLLVYNILFCGVMGVVIVLVCSYMLFRDKELPKFGQADFLVFAHCMTFCCFTYTSGAMLVITMIIWLFVLGVYAFTYRTPEGERWKPFHNMLIPAIPAYGISIFIVSPLRILLTDKLFSLGF